MTHADPQHGHQYISGNESTAAPKFEDSPMAPPTWTMPEQSEFLLSWSTLYEEHHATRNYETFWPKVYVAWFARWPIQAVPIDPALMTEGDKAALAAALKKRRGVR